MKKFLILMFMIGIFANFVLAEDLSYFVAVRLDYESDDLTLHDLDLIEGNNFNPDLGFETHKVELFSFDGGVLYDLMMYVPIPDEEFMPLDATSSPPVLPDYNIITFTVPYYGSGKEVIFTSLETGKRLVVDISEYATCNQDGICDLQESIATCAEDCEMKKEVVEEIEKVEEVEEVEEQAAGRNLLIVIGIIFVLALIVVLLVLKRRKQM